MPTTRLPRSGRRPRARRTGAPSLPPDRCRRRTCHPACRDCGRHRRTNRPERRGDRRRSPGRTSRPCRPRRRRSSRRRRRTPLRGRCPSRCSDRRPHRESRPRAALSGSRWPVRRSPPYTGSRRRRPPAPRPCTPPPSRSRRSCRRPHRRTPCRPPSRRGHTAPSLERRCRPCTNRRRRTGSTRTCTRIPGRRSRSCTRFHLRTAVAALPGRWCRRTRRRPCTGPHRRRARRSGC
jgi:hypothetical protein